MDHPNYITPAGHAALIARHIHLFQVERPQIVETVSWAAGNGDRSENGDYIYGRKRLREIDRELSWISKRLKAAVVVGPAAQPDKRRAFFGATVCYVEEDDTERTVTLVGEDEIDIDKGRISLRSPVAIALKSAAAGDTRVLKLPGGNREVEILAVTYPDQ